MEAFKISISTKPGQAEQDLTVLTASNPIDKNYNEAMMDADFFHYAEGGEEEFSPLFEGFKQRREERHKARMERKASKVELRKAKAQAKTTKADAKLEGAMAQSKVAESLGKDSGVVVPTEETPTGMSTGAKIGIAVAVVVVLGAITYFVIKKKQKTA